MANEKEVIAKAPSGRPTRQPVGSRNRFKFSNQDPNYVYRVAVDYEGTGDRIAELKEAGYEHVPAGTHSSRDSRVDQAATPEGTVEMMNVGAGNKGYLMRQKKEFYEEDQLAKAERITKTEEALKTPLDGSYGKIDLNAKEK